MSTFGGTTDLIGYEENVRYVPTADMVMHAANIPLVSAPYGLEIKACRRKIRSPARMFQISRLTSEQWKSTLVVIFGLGGE